MPLSCHAAFPLILLVLYWLAQKMGDAFISFSIVLFEWTGQAGNCPSALDQ